MKINSAGTSLVKNNGISRILPGTSVTVKPEVLSPLSTTPQKQLEDELAKIDKQFDLYGTNPYNLQKDIGYTELQYTPLTDDEIKKYASDSLAEYKVSEANRINSGAARETADLTAAKAAAEKAAEKAQAQLDTLYDAAKTSSSNDALKRGLARSSIIVNKLSALESAKAQGKADVSDTMFRDIMEIDDKIAALETKRLNALDDFDIVYAAKLGAEIKAQQEARQQRLDEVVKYNNTLKKSSADYGLDYAKTDSSLNKDVFDKNAEIAEKDLIAKIQESVYEQKYEVISAYLNNMTAKDAVNDLENRKDYYLQQLGKSGYDKMLVLQRGRK